MMPTLSNQDTVSYVKLIYMLLVYTKMKMTIEKSNPKNEIKNHEIKFRKFVVLLEINSAIKFM